MIPPKKLISCKCMKWDTCESSPFTVHYRLHSRTASRQVRLSARLTVKWDKILGKQTETNYVLSESRPADVTEKTHPAYRSQHMLPSHVRRRGAVIGQQDHLTASHRLGDFTRWRSAAAERRHKRHSVRRCLLNWVSAETVPMATADISLITATMRPRLKQPSDPPSVGPTRLVSLPLWQPKRCIRQRTSSTLIGLLAAHDVTRSAVAPLGEERQGADEQRRPAESDAEKSSDGRFIEHQTSVMAGCAASPRWGNAGVSVSSVSALSYFRYEPVSHCIWLHLHLWWWCIY